MQRPAILLSAITAVLVLASTSVAQQLGGGFGSSSFNGSGIGSNAGFGGGAGGFGGGFGGQSNFGNSAALGSGFTTSMAFGITGAETQRPQGTTNFQSVAPTANQQNGRQNQGRMMQQAGAANAQIPGMARHFNTRLGFEAPVVPQATIVQNAGLSLNSTVLPGSSGLNVQVADGVATLRGNVLSDADSRRAAALLSLEPGIRQIRNELVIQPAQ